MDLDVNLVGNLSKRKLVLHRDGNKCLRCGSTENLTLDHVLPLCLGGKNHHFNLQTLCGRCNRWKANMVMDFRTDEQKTFDIYIVYNSIMEKRIAKILA